MQCSTIEGESCRPSEAQYYIGLCRLPDCGRDIGRLDCYRRYERLATLLLEARDDAQSVSTTFEIQSWLGLMSLCELVDWFVIVIVIMLLRLHSS